MSGLGTGFGSCGCRRPCRRGACRDACAGSRGRGAGPARHQGRAPASGCHAGCRAQPRPARGAPSVDYKVALCARFSAIRRIRADLGAPLSAGTAALSWEARLQFSCPASQRHSSSTRWSLLQTPAVCQLRSLRQHVMPEHPNSRCSISQGEPERRTKMIPARAKRSSHRGRPPFGLAGSTGSSGASAAHRSSDTRGLLMSLQRTRAGFVKAFR